MELYFGAHFELESMFSRQCWHHISGGKSHDGPARFEPRSLVFGTYDHPLRRRRYLTVVVNICTYVNTHFEIIITIAMNGEQFCIWQFILWQTAGRSEGSGR